MLHKEELKALSSPRKNKKKPKKPPKNLEYKWRRQLIYMSGIRDVIIVE